MQNQGFTLKKADPKISRTPNAATGKPASECIEPDTCGWWTRNECAAFLKRSAATIGNYERLGKLKPQYVYQQDSRGIEHRVAVYDPKEIQKLKGPELRSPTVRDPGEVAAICFERFNEGKTRRDVVIELKITPDHAQHLFTSWEMIGRELTISQDARETLENRLGTFTGIEGLLTRVDDLVKRVQDLTY